MNDLFSRSDAYPRVNRKIVDPPGKRQPKYALFSFVKATDVVPDADGFFGVAKIRGCFDTEEEAEERAEELMREVDSTNRIYTCLIGMPFPLVTKGFAKNVSEVDLRNKIEKTISDNARAKRREEEKEMREMKERQEALMKNDGSIDPSEEDKYVEQRVKLAHLRYAIAEHEAKRIECRQLELLVRRSLAEAKDRNPEFETNYMERYKRGRREANIPEETDLTGFMKYMADPIDPLPAAATAKRLGDDEPDLASVGKRRRIDEELMEDDDGRCPSYIS